MKVHTFEEINKIVAELVVNRTHIENTMNIPINIMGIGYHDMLDIKN